MRRARCRSSAAAERAHARAADPQAHDAHQRSSLGQGDAPNHRLASAGNVNRCAAKDTASSACPSAVAAGLPLRHCASVPELPTRAARTFRLFGHRGGSNATGRRGWPLQ